MVDFTELRAGKKTKPGRSIRLLLKAGEEHKARDKNVDIMSTWMVFKTTGQSRGLCLRPGAFQL